MLHWITFELTPANVVLWGGTAILLLTLIGQIVKRRFQKPWVPRVTVALGFLAAVITSVMAGHSWTDGFLMAAIGIVSGGMPTVGHELTSGFKRYKVPDSPDLDPITQKTRVLDADRSPP
jgi:Na+/melibiose symporter-like transporter